MKGGREKLMSHVIMVVAPLLVLLMVTLAWFVNARTISVSELSFAAQTSGPGAVLYPHVTLEGRSYTGAALTHSAVIWGEKLEDDKADITITNMLPGQCAYYLLVSDKKFVPTLETIQITNANGTEITTQADAEKLLLTQCLGLYLTPTGIDLTQTPTGQTDPNVAIPLTRDAAGRLENALFKAGSGAAAFPALPKEQVKTAYILAIYCDGVYGQNGSTADSRKIHTGVLPGTISFSLAFDTEV